MGGVNSAKQRDSSFSEGAGYVCLGVVQMEEEVQDRIQVEVGREEQGTGETRKGTRRGTESQRTNAQPLIMDDHVYGVMRT